MCQYGKKAGGLSVRKKMQVLCQYGKKSIDYMSSGRKECYVCRYGERCAGCVLGVKMLVVSVWEKSAGCMSSGREECW